MTTTLTTSTTLAEIQKSMGLGNADLKTMFGKMNGPIMGDRVLSRPLDHFISKGIEAHALIVVDREAGTFTAINLYRKQVKGKSQWTAGAHYDPKWNTNPITEKAEAKWEEKGYAPVEDSSLFSPIVVVRPQE